MVVLSHKCSQTHSIEMAVFVLFNIVCQKSVDWHAIQKNKLLYSASISLHNMLIHTARHHTVLAQNVGEENRGRARKEGDKRNESEMVNLISFISVVCR